MSKRSLVAVTATLATLGVALTALGAPSTHHERHAPPRVHLAGTVVDWDADAGSLTLEAPDVWGGARAVRHLLGAATEVDLVVGPRTRIFTDDDQGLAARIGADELFADLEGSAEDLEVDAAGRIAPGAPRDPDAVPTLNVQRLILHLPASDEAGDEVDGPPATDAPGDEGQSPEEGAPQEAPHPPHGPRPPR